jgi:hypothetical protein
VTLTPSTIQRLVEAERDELVGEVHTHAPHVRCYPACGAYDATKTLRTVVESDDFAEHLYDALFDHELGQLHNWEQSSEGLRDAVRLSIRAALAASVKGASDD